MLNPSRRLHIFNIPWIFGAFKKCNATAILHLKENMDMGTILTGRWDMIFTHGMRKLQAEYFGIKPSSFFGI
jgi:hypothetical protein